jgi:hypothetical protein
LCIPYNMHCVAASFKNAHRISVIFSMGRRVKAIERISFWPSALKYSFINFSRSDSP